MTHQPVLLNEVIELLDPKKGEVIIDGTAGSGGHAEVILKIIGNKGKLLLVDWDKKNITNLKKKFFQLPNVILSEGNYADLPEIMAVNNFPKVDGLLLDLGFSSEQLRGRNRGFSFNPPAGGEPLIMTYSDSQEPLGEFLQRTTTEELTEIISKFGEERYVKKIAEAIMANRSRIKTSLDLAEIIKKVVPKSYELGRIHPATRTFQAFRIYLNKELKNLEKVLGVLDEILKSGGRVAIISFHSLEDRIVKNNFKELAKKGRLKILTQKLIRPTAEEVSSNPRSRSAKLRVGIIV